MKRIPLYSTEGELRAHALVDDDLYEWLAQWRWFLSDGYVARYAGWRDEDGRRVQRQVKLHRQIMGLEFGDPRQVDHEDGNPLNNQRVNLRLATAVLNGQNRKLNTNSTTGYRGVSRDNHAGRSRPYLAYVNVNKVRHKLGFFATAEEAAEAVEAFRAQHLPYSPEASSAATE